MEISQLPGRSARGLGPNHQWRKGIQACIAPLANGARDARFVSAALEIHISKCQLVTRAVMAQSGIFVCSTTVWNVELYCTSTAPSLLVKSFAIFWWRFPLSCHLLPIPRPPCISNVILYMDAPHINAQTQTGATIENLNGI